jgi:hypothetical protein
MTKKILISDVFIQLPPDSTNSPALPYQDIALSYFNEKKEKFSWNLKLPPITRGQHHETSHSHN